MADKKPEAVEDPPVEDPVEIPPVEAPAAYEATSTDVEETRAPAPAVYLGVIGRGPGGDPSAKVTPHLGGYSTVGWANPAHNPNSADEPFAVVLKVEVPDANLAAAREEATRQAQRLRSALLGTTDIHETLRGALDAIVNHQMVGAAE